MSDNDKYLELIGRVAKIDIHAALYMRHDAREISAFTCNTHLSVSFIWKYTPQGWYYWKRIHDQLTLQDS